MRGAKGKAKAKKATPALTHISDSEDEESAHSFLCTIATRNNQKRKIRFDMNADIVKYEDDPENFGGLSVNHERKNPVRPLNVKEYLHGKQEVMTRNVSNTRARAVGILNIA